MRWTQGLMTVGVILLADVARAAETSAHPSATDLLRDLRRLSVTGSVLFVAAHPDDENTELLAYFANDRLLRTGYLSLTRGEGGQNLLGSEKGPLLGMLRTQELLAARRIDGAEQFFTRARDFGFSKSVSETLEVWGKDDVLADIVWVVRNLQPDVVITRFPLEAAQTHGHHTASARLALEAFHAAADPSFQPEQLKYVTVWQAKRIVWNEWEREPGEPQGPASISLSVGGYNPLLGRSYGEIAAQSRSMHKSQGFGAAPSHGPQEEKFVPLGGTPGASLFDGVDLSWGRVAHAQNLRTLLKQAEREFQVDAPSASIPLLLTALEALRRLPDSGLKIAKEHQLTELVAGCAGLFLEATATEHQVSPGQPLEVSVVVLNRSAANLHLQALRLTGAPAQLLNAPLTPNLPRHAKATLTVPLDARLTQPYWLDAPPKPGTWQVTSLALVGKPELPSSLQATFVVESQGHTLEFVRPISFKWTDPTSGERFREVEIVPPVLVNVEAKVLMFPDAIPRPLHVALQAGVDGVKGRLVPEVPPGWRVVPMELPFALGARGEISELSFRIYPPDGPAGARNSGTVTVTAVVDAKRWSQGLLHVEYPHIPIQALQPRAEVQVRRFDLAKGRTRLGYIPGSGDDVAAALRQVGYDVTALDDEALRTKPLAPYAAIIVGVRAYNTNPQMPRYHARLMEYVSGGGTLLAQYNTKNWVSSVPAQIGPYPFEISRERVTDETAAVGFVNPRSPFLTTPNLITSKDFESWTQERGLYFAGTWDPRYETLFSMHDPSEAPERGSVLIGKYGKGVFIYTGLAFFRQLPAGVPGAYRLFANLVAHGR